MTILTRSYRGLTFDAKAMNDEARSIDVICSTPTEDSYEEIVEQTWRLDRYKKNPIVLYEHGHASGWFGGDSEDKFPIAKAENVRVEGGVLKATLVFAPANVSERAERVWQAMKGGFLRAVSVGFRPHNARVETHDGREVYVLSDNELYEISVVAIPANPDAVAEQRSKSLRAMTNPQPPAAASGAPATESKTMSLLSFIAKAIGCEENEAAATVAFEKFLTNAKSAQSFQAAARTALSLPETATEADVSKAVVVLTAKAAKADELEPKLVELKGELTARSEADAKREVEWLIKHGAKYGTEVSEKSRNALMAYRKSDPKGFADDYVAALEGLKSFDNTMLFQDVAAPSAKAATPPPQEASAVDHEDELERRIDELMRKAAADGKPITRAKALDLVARSDA